MFRSVAMRKSVRDRVGRIWLAAALIVTLIPAAPNQVAAAPEKPTLLGFATADFEADLPDFIQQAGRAPAMDQLYWDLGAWSQAKSAGAQRILGDFQAIGVTAYVEVTTNSLGALNGGDQDANLNEMARGVGDWLKGGSGRRVLIAPLPEMNLTHAWGGDPNGFKSGYRRIRQAFVDQGLAPHQIRFVFAPNGTSDVGEYDDYYPGDSVVDLIGFAKINRGNPWRDYDVTFQMHIDELRARVSVTKPILITQTGSVTQNGDRAKWLNDMFTGLKAHDQVIGAIYFNRDKDGYDTRVLINGNLDSTFRTGYQQWSHPDEVSWIFDGRMDAWVNERATRFSGGFADVDGHIFASAIAWLADQGITEGCNPPRNTLFCPDDAVTRGQMAIFISRALGLPTANGDHFTDDNGSVFEGAANRLYEAGITAGCRTNRYCGDQPISRDQMAAFLARTLSLSATARDFFIDDNGSILETAINKIAAAGITEGCNPPANDRFCPGGNVTRGQMAAFLKRALGG